MRVLLSPWNKLAQESTKLTITIPRPELEYVTRGHHQSNTDIVVSIALLNLMVVVEVATCPNAHNKVHSLPGRAYCPP